MPKLVAKSTFRKLKKTTTNYAILTSTPAFHTKVFPVVSGYSHVISGNFPVESGLLISLGRNLEFLRVAPVTRFSRHLLEK